MSDISNIKLLGTTYPIKDVYAREKLKTIDKKYIIIADSYGLNDDNSVGGVINNIIEYMGLTSGVNVFYHAIGGSGFTPLLENTFIDVLNVVISNLENNNIDKSTITDIIICGGYNDNSFSHDVVNYGINNFDNVVKTNFSNAKIRLFGCGNSITGYIRNNLYEMYNLVYSRVASRVGWCFYDVSKCLISDYFSDDKHPNAAGKYFLGVLISNYLNGGDTNVRLRDSQFWVNGVNIATINLNDKYIDFTFFISGVITFSTPITLSTTYTEIGTWESSIVTGCDIDNLNAGTFYISSILNVDGTFEKHTVNFTFADDKKVYAKVVEINSTGTDYLTIDNVNSIQVSYQTCSLPNYIYV